MHNTKNSTGNIGMVHGVSSGTENADIAYNIESPSDMIKSLIIDREDIADIIDTFEEMVTDAISPFASDQDDENQAEMASEDYANIMLLLAHKAEYERDFIANICIENNVRLKRIEEKLGI